MSSIADIKIRCCVHTCPGLAFICFDGTQYGNNLAYYCQIHMIKANLESILHTGFPPKHVIRELDDKDIPDSLKPTKELAKIIEKQQEEQTARIKKESPLKTDDEILKGFMNDVLNHSISLSVVKPQQKSIVLLVEAKNGNLNILRSTPNISITITKQTRQPQKKIVKRRKAVEYK